LALRFLSTKSTPSIPDLIDAAGLLKRVKRTGWLKKAGITSDRESVADHSFRMAIIALIIGFEMQVDAAKLVRMCLIHDLAESATGDKMPEEKESSEAHRRTEDRVIRGILGQLPKRSRTVLEGDWNELFETSTPEAKLAWQIDKLEMLLQAEDYMRMGYDKKKLSEFTKTKLDKHFKKMAEQLQLSV
jgi:putative hydrolases of HD superfamily